MKAVDAVRRDRSDEQIIQKGNDLAAKNIQRAFRARLQRKKIAEQAEKIAEQAEKIAEQADEITALKQQLKLADAGSEDD